MEMMKTVPKLSDMTLLRRGMRLSIQPVTSGEWETVVTMGTGT